MPISSSREVFQVREPAQAPSQHRGETSLARRGNRPTIPSMNPQQFALHRAALTESNPHQTMKTKFVLVCALFALLTAMPLLGAENWKDKLQKELPLLGHRNWIVVADSAYPLQTAPGIVTISTDTDHVVVVKEVLAALAKTKHVKPVVYTDAEMKFVSETNAPGIGAYRKALAGVLAGQPVQVLPHEQIIGKLDEAGKTFRVLIIKTPLAKPYTSVFFNLDCGYWNAASEKELREAMK